MIPNFLSDIRATIGPAVGNHLWQSTLFAIASGLLTLLLGKNHARGRGSQRWNDSENQERGIEAAGFCREVGSLEIRFNKAFRSYVARCFPGRTPLTSPNKY